MIGTTLSHYRILEQLGAGGMGVVYRARDERLERDVALKVLPAGALADEAERRRFRREALALSRLNHPGIAVIHDFDTESGNDFLIMELVAGATLAERIRSGPLPEREIFALGLQIAEALEIAHEQGVLHRDLKPGNIVVTPRGQVKVLDFGLARLLQGSIESDTRTATTSRLALEGTLQYMAPEQLLGGKVDTRADLYALGVVLFEMATGRLPHEQRLATALVYEIVHAPPPAPGRIRQGLSTRLEELILKALEKDPADRYQSAREMVVDLRRAEAGGGARQSQAAPG